VRGCHVLGGGGGVHNLFSSPETVNGLRMREDQSSVLRTAMARDTEFLSKFCF
jgi:hypothetical protein